ncbi:MAG: hypothetical protein V3U76_09955 [Granulosicoccus sp.]
MHEKYTRPACLWPAKGIGWFFIALACLALAIPLQAENLSDENSARTEAIGSKNDQDATTAEKTASDERATLERLLYIQKVISAKVIERSKLGERIEAANEQDKDDLRKQADNISNDIRQLRSTLESIATGGADTSLFVEQPTTVESDWREDITLIAQPVIDSLKELTEKPRRLKELNDVIVLHQKEMAAADNALLRLKPQLALNPDGALGSSLNRLHTTWQQRRDDADSAIEIAHFQIADLQGDKSLPQTIYEAVLGFIKGRGLTLLMAVAAGIAVWYGIQFLMRGYRHTLVDKDTAESRTRYRLVAYSVHALTFLTIMIAVFVVFYERGDVLLLGLLILLIVGLALSVRQLLPRYMREARLLLNIGAMRETQRIQYRGLPWRVESINMYTVLRNPELHGVLRIPLAELHGVTSRPAGKDQWFPTSRGDVVLLDDDTVLVVIDQNPDTVELRQRGGQMLSMPTTDFYAASMTNLSRSGSFGVSEYFGIDYQHQSIATNDVPRTLRAAIRESLASSDVAEFVKDVEVEIKEAGSSSLDYWIFATFDSRAAKSYCRIKRMIQTACINTCTSEQWDIPFPHLSVVQKPVVVKREKDKEIK